MTFVTLRPFILVMPVFIDDLMSTCFYSNSILEAVYLFYKEKFPWKQKKLHVFAALVLESKIGGTSLFKTVVFTMGTKWKNQIKCSFLCGEKKLWDICDGHAEALCYRLASVYMLSEIYKIHNDREDSSIFQKTPRGYELKEGKRLHLFISYHPCGFMRTKDDKSFWKLFTNQNSPHIPNCSSKILIGAYLGIQGPLSCLLTKPVYISSVVILDNEMYSGKKEFSTISDCHHVFKDWDRKLATTSERQAPFENKQHDEFWNHLRIPEIHIIKNFQFPRLPKSSPTDGQVGFILPDLINAKNNYLFEKFDIHKCNKTEKSLQNYVIALKRSIKLKVPSSIQKVRYDLLTNATEKLQCVLKIAKNDHEKYIKIFFDYKLDCYYEEIRKIIIHLLENGESFQKISIRNSETAVNNAYDEVCKCKNAIMVLNNLDEPITLNKIDCDWARYICEMKDNMRSFPEYNNLT